MSWPIQPLILTDDELHAMEQKLNSGEALSTPEAWGLIRAINGLKGLLKAKEQAA